MNRSDIRIDPNVVASVDEYQKYLNNIARIKAEVARQKMLSAYEDMRKAQASKGLKPSAADKPGLEEPWIDPTSAFAGGFGGSIARKGLLAAIRAGTAAAIADYPLGLATAGAAHINPKLAMPANIVGGMLSGATFERGLENIMEHGSQRLTRFNPYKAILEEAGQVDVWHGSPHRFEKFSTDKIGTGEGAQSFGWGLYFTDQKSIARHYSSMGKTLDRTKLLIDGVNIEDIFEDKNIIREIKTGASPKTKNGKFPSDVKDAIISYLDEGIKINENFAANDPIYANIAKSDNEKLKHAISIIKSSNNIDVSDSANVYKATLFKGKDPSEYRWLDWDKDIDTDLIQKKISKIDKKIGDRFKSAIEDSNGFADLYENPEDASKWNGREIYRWLSEKLGSDKEASLFLQRAGIDGIRYPAGTLSGGGKGTNYVVFDENAITVEGVE